ncbi:MAG: glycosyl hydrolase-related protein [Bifidobacteriaceae bacterium]|jgi:alpha-mannosidase|nr:glycosyl hydrolase-related protein [Bifidobacteriaceae bacterium]
MHDDSQAVVARIDRLLAERIVPAVHSRRVAADVEAWEAPGEPVPFDVAVGQEYRPLGRGEAWGRPWGTTWLRVTAQVPADWPDPGPGVENGAGPGVELLVDLGFTDAYPGFQAEGLAYTASGKVIKGVEPRNSHVPVAARPGETVEVYVEAASNPDIARGGDFTPTPLGALETAGAELLYRFGGVDLALFDAVVWELAQDVRTLRGVVDVVPADRPRHQRVLAALAQMADALDPDRVGETAAGARSVLAGVLASPANASAHRVVAVGHAHIDSAWLWPVRETARKCARTFSNVLDLMDRYPDLVFAASSAQQYAWVKDRYPELFDQIKARVAEGRFVPVGSMWVEADTNMPGGEAMARQLLFGKRFFLEEFGVDTQEVWLPDSFGYSGALPQIALGAGNRWFLTQKISWNDTNTMPHHTFHWEGIDGSRIFTHFPPVDRYNSDLSAGELDLAERQFKEKRAADTSLVPFGYGDGGGGPTREMIAAARRAADLEGLPRVRIASPKSFFEAAEAEYPDPPVWSGELYLEYHRGTYTSQARTKRGNRRSEHLLREAELWAAAAHVWEGLAYPYEELEQCWQTVLLQQFHDILPGSAIAWVHRQAERNYRDVAAHLERVIGSSLKAVAGEGGAEVSANAGPFRAGGVPALGLAAAPSPVVPAACRPEGDGWRLDNGLVSVLVDGRGLLASVVDLASGRETVPDAASAGLLQIHRDTPSKWDAWDVDAWYRRVTEDLADPEAIGVVDTPEGPAVEVRRVHGASTIVERITLPGGSAAVDFEFDIDWHERQKLLKLAFPVAVKADRFASETQFGHVWRPTHANTSWDDAKYEVCAHRWVHVAEPGFGVGVANDSTYGHDVRATRTGGIGGTGGTGGISGARGTGVGGGGGGIGGIRWEDATVIRLSLLRAPLYPDPDADQGLHKLRCSLVIGGVIDAAAAGYRLNLPARRVTGDPDAASRPPLVAVEGGTALVEAVKLADDRSGDVIVRLYEALGGRSRSTLTPGFEWAEMVETDLLERPAGAPTRPAGAGTVELTLRPFEIRTLRITPAASG